MRNILILSPHFPPTDAVDMHRIRTTVGYYREHGWNPQVLAVRPEDAKRNLDVALAGTVPRHVRKVQVSAPSLPGLSALGLRAWPALYKAGSRLLEEERHDLVLISTTAFPAMSLGRAWKDRFGTPFVLDFQDPWATFPPSASPYLRLGGKRSLMRALHKRLERWTVPEAAGLMAVSSGYIEILQQAYPALRDKPMHVSPFGYASSDFAAAERLAKSPPRDPGRPVWYFAGRIAPPMEGAVARLMSVLVEGRSAWPSGLASLRLRFFGTGYSTTGNPPVATRIAAGVGASDFVEEYPDRLPLLEALKGMLDADVLVVFGSDDAAYIPSKLYQCLSLPKPVICVAPAASQLRGAVEGMDGVLFLSTDQSSDGPAAIQALLTRKIDYGPRIAQIRGYDARDSARRDCEFLSRVLDARGEAPGAGKAHKIDADG